MTRPTPEPPVCLTLDASLFRVNSDKLDLSGLDEGFEVALYIDRAMIDDDRRFVSR